MGKRRVAREGARDLAAVQFVKTADIVQILDGRNQRRQQFGKGEGGIVVPLSLPLRSVHACVGGGCGTGRRRPCCTRPPHSLPLRSVRGWVGGGDPPSVWNSRRDQSVWDRERCVGQVRGIEEEGVWDRRRRAGRVRQIRVCGTQRRRLGEGARVGQGERGSESGRESGCKGEGTEGGRR